MLIFLTIAIAVTAWPVSETGPSGTYAPIRSTCPSNHTFLRSASGLNSQEAAWRGLRVQKVIPALQDYLNQNPIPDFDVSNYIEHLWKNQSDAPVMAFTFSGGGWRSAYPGLGLYDALDGRNPASVQAGTGGLFQAMTYNGALSGGTIAITPLAIFGYPPLSDLIDGNNYNGSTNETALTELALKGKAGFPVNGADLLGGITIPNTLQNNQNLNPTAFTWSGIQVQESFMNGGVPMPFVVSAEVIPSGLTDSISYNATGPYYNGSILLPWENTTVVYEFTPWEFGSWVGRVQGFSDVHYLGTPLYNSAPVNGCVEGYDTAVFVVGTAEDSLSDWSVQVESGGTMGQFAKRDTSLPGDNLVPLPSDYVQMEQKADVDGVLGTISALPSINKLLNEPPQDYFYGKIPNPFQGWEQAGSAVATQQDLWLVDAGMAHQESPLFPLLQPARGVDYIIISDACNEALGGWQNGTSLIESARLAKLADLPFPSVPASVDTMLHFGYTSQPVFFGCNDAADVPLILYAADYPYSAYGNLSILDTQARTPDQVRALTGNTLPLLSQQGFRDNWNECLACGAVYRSLQRMGRKLPPRCTECMLQYCWNGTEAGATEEYLQPVLALNPELSYEQWNATVFF